MTEQQIHEYRIRYEIDQITCQRCGITATQIAHRLSKSKVNYRLYKREIIDNNINLVSVCGLDCNSYFNIGCSTEKIKRLVSLIKERGNERLSSVEVTRVIND